MSYAFAVLLWLLMLFASYPYVKRHHNPDQHLVAAYMIFITVFSAAAFFFFALLTRALPWLGWAAMDSAGPVVAAAVVSLVPAFYLARWQIRKPGIHRPPPT
jgi:hypothetical protein